MAYQTFDDTSGRSDSAAKLTAIRMPARLNGKRVLDIGCNEGFFSLEAKRRGAADVLGLDTNADAIRRARRRADNITFLHQSWHSLPEGQFDLILLLSALHYESRPRELLRALSSHLADDGILILECGVVMESGTSLRWTQRHDEVQHPTFDMLIDHYLEPFAVRFIGRSVDQPADVVRRYVFHCSRRKPIVLLIGGSTGEGKGVLAREIKNQFSIDISVDRLLLSMKAAKRPNTPLLKEISICTAEGISAFGQIVRRLEAKNLENELAEAILAQIPLDERLVIVEGHGLTDRIVNYITERIGDSALVWVAQRSRSEEELRALETEALMSLEHARAEIQTLKVERHGLRQAEAENLKELALLREALSLHERRLA